MPSLARPSGRERNYQQQYDRGIQETGRQGSALMGNFTSGITNYNPQQAFERRVTAAQQGFKRDFGRNLGKLRSQQSARGRTKTGFAFQDEDRLFQGMSEHLNEVIGNAALQTSGLELDRLGLAGSVGGALSGRAMDARGGEYHTERAQRFTDQADRRNMWTSIIGSIFGAGGQIAGARGGG